MVIKPYNPKPKCDPGESEPSFVVVHVVAAIAIVAAVSFACWWLTK